MTGALLKGRKQPQWLIDKRAAANRGGKRSEETRRLLSEKALLRPKDPMAAERARARFAGKQLSAEHRAKISAALTGIKRSPETRALLSASKSGEKSLWWRGGVALMQRSTTRYKKWRKSILASWDGTCAICKSPVGSDEKIVDHIKAWTPFPELRFETSNGQVLCRPCNVIKTRDELRSYGGRRPKRVSSPA